MQFQAYFILLVHTLVSLYRCCLSSVLCKHECRKYPSTCNIDHLLFPRIHDINDLHSLCPPESFSSSLVYLKTNSQTRARAIFLLATQKTLHFVLLLCFCSYYCICLSFQIPLNGILSI